MEVIDRIVRAGADPAAHAGHAGQVALLESLCDTMQHGSMCAMGGMTPYPVRSALNHYSQDFGIESTTAAAAA